MMAIPDWCDVAWAYLMRNTPMMASPSEYRDLLWNALYVGELSDEQKADQAKRAVEDRKPGRKRASAKMPAAAYDEMDEMVRKARALRGEPEPPE